MSLATRCPHCKTIFHVSEEQLRMRAGTVRCGVCRELFNGIDNLAGRIPPDHAVNTIHVTEKTDDHPQSIAAASKPVLTTGQPVSVPSAEALKESFDKQLQSISLDLDTGTVPEKNASSPETVGNIAEYPAEPNIDEKRPSSPSDMPMPSVMSSPVPSGQPATSPQNDTGGALHGNSSADLLDAIHRKKRKSRIAGIFWLTGSIILAIVLCGQIVYHYSTNIVAWWPPAKGLVGSACELLSCPSENIHVSKNPWHVEYGEPVAAENAAGQFTQSITMFHDSDSPQPWPALVVEITSPDNRILSRKVIEPGEYLAEEQQTLATWPAGEKNHIQLFIEQPHDTVIHSRIVPLNH